MKLFKTASFFLFAFSSLSWSSDLQNENLIQTLPEGYKVDFQGEQGNMTITEMVPQSETVENWTEMITTQVFLGMNDVSTEEFQSRIDELWSASCKDSKVFSIAKGEENGYPFSFWMQSCPLNKDTGKPEITFFKAMKGNDSFYVVQKAFKSEPTKEQIVQWSNYFKKITVCDTRIPERMCPKVNQ